MMMKKRTDVLGYRVATERLGSNPVAAADGNDGVGGGDYTAADAAGLLPLESCFPD